MLKLIEALSDFNLFLLFTIGDYVNNKKDGDGIFWWTAGSHAGDKYEGQFKNDQR